VLGDRGYFERLLKRFGRDLAREKAVFTDEANRNAVCEKITEKRSLYFTAFNERGGQLNWNPIFWLSEYAVRKLYEKRVGSL